MNKKVILTIITVFLTLSALSFMPTTWSKPVKTIQIGVVFATDDGLEALVPIFEEIIEPDINEYVAKLPRKRFSPRMEYEFLYESAEGNSITHLEKVQYFNSIDVDIVIGGFWSGQAMGSLSYMDENDMLLISPSSTLPVLAIPDDNLFRLSLDDTKQGPAIAKMILSQGIDKITVIQCDDALCDGVYDEFETEYEAWGGNILLREHYDPGATDFTEYLIDAEAVATGSPDEGVLILSYDEAATIVTQAQSYTKIYNLLWFGSETTAMAPILTKPPADIPSAHLKIYSTLAAPVNSSKFMEMAERYEEITVPFGYYAANMIDAAWIIVQAVLEAKPTFPVEFTATDVIKVLPDIASRYFGYSGWCLLNEAGDRAKGNYDIWGYESIDGVTENMKFGFYDSVTGEVIWYP